LAGISKMRWSRFLVANAAGGLLWSGFYAFGAYALGGAASGVSSTLTIVGYVVASVVTVTTIVMVRVMLRRLEQRAETAFPDGQPATQAPPQHQATAR
jgi:membrane protein DedA with SNARE-associated domain